MKQIFEDCKRVEIEDDGNRAYKTINIIRKHGISVKIDISYARLKGDWVYKKFDEETGISNSYFCSKCGCSQGQVYINFCGQCGADMRGEEE